MYVARVNPLKSEKWTPPLNEETMKIRRQAGAETETESSVNGGNASDATYASHPDEPAKDNGVLHRECVKQIKEFEVTTTRDSEERRTIVLYCISYRYLIGTE